MTPSNALYESDVGVVILVLSCVAISVITVYTAVCMMIITVQCVGLACKVAPPSHLSSGSSPANAPAAPPASSDNTVAIAIGVAVPCAVVAALVIIGAALYVRRMRRGGGAPAPLTAEGPKDVTLESGGSGYVAHDDTWH